MLLHILHITRLSDSGITRYFPYITGAIEKELKKTGKSAFRYLAIDDKRLVSYACNGCK